MAEEMKKEFHGADVGGSLSVSETDAETGDTKDLGPDKSHTYVRVTPDKKEAWLYLVEKENKKPYTLDELIDILNENGVCKGIKNDLLIPMAKKCVYQREIKVATYIKPVAGEDGYYEYYFDEKSNQKTPKIREDGSVDYQSMNMINSVQKGAALALYHPAKEGVPGYDVCGNEISTDPIKNLLDMAGKNVTVSPDNPNLYIAEKDGRVEFSEGKVSINDIYELKDDVDQLIGKVEFYGDVHLSGNVESGVTVRAGKNLTIDGTVEAANIFAGGDIVLKRGIQGNQKANIVCRGNIYAEFIEHTNVKCNGNVQANVIMNSHVESEGKVILTGKKGQVIGGYIHGTDGVECKILGNDSEVKTIVHVGCVPEIYHKYQELVKEETQLKESLDSIFAELKEIEGRVRLQGSITESMEKRVKQIKLESHELTERQNACKEKLGEVTAYMRRASSAKIRVEGDLNLGSIICIGRSKLQLEEKTSYMEYRDISGMIAGKGING